MIRPATTQSNGSPKSKQKPEGKGHKQQSTNGWTGGVTKDTLRGAIISNGKKKAPQFNILMKKLILYCGEQGYQYLPEIIHTLTDKPPDNKDVNKPDPDTT